MQKTKSDSVLHPESNAVNKNIKIQSTNNDFPKFWKTFRKAVISFDTIQIINMTQFPFKTRGTSDYDPTVEHNKEKFVSVFKSFIKQWNGLNMNGTTELDHIRKTETPDETYVQKEHARVGNLEFKRINNEWKLVFAYLNYDTIESLEK
ncbi:hypothetical protein NAT47_11735 [Flavobacterium sp. HXWNR69]|uniref:SnoaL-like domain-containing protein n=1 Tax=Flavobacterium fragile TaxID=2949085 RepID=A0ABT0TJC0_9FLAO|nr:hypothetical protein [Flavobacterium sp. HXWNR69]MCL9771086.1 hypothetical protein [Flavobacterium sp. HXWNR69]